MKKCAVEGCEGKLHGNTYCERHYRQLIRKGRIFERTKADLNKIYIKEDYCEMNIYNKKSEVVAQAFFDIEDYDRVSKHHWHLSTGKYARNATLGYLHNFILNHKFAGHAKQIDHINRNKLDCRKENLRFVDHTGNAINRDVQKNNISGQKGITWCKQNGKWSARIARDGKEYFLGYFLDLDEAVKVRKEAEAAYHVINCVC